MHTLFCSLLIAVALVTFCARDEPEPVAPYGGPFIGNVNTHVYHRPSCNRLPNPENRISIATCEEAHDGAWDPCDYCEPCQ